MAIKTTIRRLLGLRVRVTRPDILETATALGEELDEIERRRTAAGFGYNQLANAGGETPEHRALRLNLTALCLSGGGIRSAAFSLGVLQSLAKMRLLNQFDYLSTVSGGGFIGGWLQVLIKESEDIERAQEKLATNRGLPLHRLRGFTNYLTPRTGAFSADVWAGIVLYLRNLVLNWLVFTPLFLLLALVPVSYRTAIAALRDVPPETLRPAIVLVAVASVVLAGSVWQACVLVPSHRSVASGFAQSGSIMTRILVPSLVWAFIAPAVINYDIMRPDDGRLRWLIPLTYAIALIAGYGVAWFLHADRSPAGQALYRRNLWRWLYATGCSTGLIILAILLIEPGGMLYRISDVRLPGQGHPWVVSRETALATFGPLWFVGTHVFHTTFYVGFRKEAVHADLDREWLARLNGGVLLIGAVWTVFALSCLMLPPLLAFATDSGSWHSLTVVSTGAGTSIAGAFGAWLGKRFASQIETAMSPAAAWTRWVPNALACVYAVGVFVCASSGLQAGLGIAAVWWSGAALNAPWHSVFTVQALCAICLSLLLVWFGGVNVNRFSMHAIYRNRLARAFLGSARERRNPDPFTGFDPNDNPHLSDFLNADSRQRLFPVINMTLNVTSGSNAAWAERKAEACWATPLTVGAAMLRHPSQPKDDSPPLGAFARTRHYAGMESFGDAHNLDVGPRLGNVLTVSGAALSPNWGYHSSPLTAFLMTLFNVRLGAWMPNPATSTAAELRLAKPKNSIFALFREMLGATTDTSQAIYLSDGGHFENLGLYEMLRRRCQRIVVIDAGQDGDCAFADLGNAIRKARIDLDVEVTVPDIHIFPRKLLEGDKAAATTALAIAVGCITYPEGGTGKILYLKPSFLADLPADVMAYGRSDTTFPHDNTANQWFSESQFESYRTLGRWHFDQLTSTTLEDLFAKARTAVARAGGSKAAHRPKRKSRCFV
jgi:Patatin-like phospholipase